MSHYQPINWHSSVRQFHEAGIPQWLPYATPQTQTLEYHADLHLAGARRTDFYLFMPAPSKSIVSVIGEVTGENPIVWLRAIQEFWKQRRLLNARGLCRVIRDLNAQLCDSPAGNVCASLSAAFLDPLRGELHYVNAGHESSLLLQGQHGDVYKLEHTAPALGLTPRVSFPARTVAMEPGALLASFTDGVLEATNARGHFFGEQNLLRRLRERLREPVKEIVDHVTGAINHFADPAMWADNRTLAVVRFNDWQQPLYARAEATELVLA